MENNFYTDEFEQLIKEKADQFRMYPSRRVWHSIYNNLHPSRRWPSFVMSILLITSLLLVGYLNTTDNTLKVSYTAPADNNNSVINTNSVGANKAGDLTPAPSSSISSQTSIGISGENNTPLNKINLNKPNSVEKINDLAPGKSSSSKYLTDINGNALFKSLDLYINTNQIFADVAAVNSKKNNPKTAKSTSTFNLTKDSEYGDENETSINNQSLVLTDLNKIAPVNEVDGSELTKLSPEKDKAVAKKETAPEKKSASSEERAWIENFALLNKPARNKWKDRLEVEFYITPAVNYRKLSTEAKGSATPFATGDINKSISQRPGLGIETGVELAYAFAKNLRLKAGIQLNYTNYNIKADQTNHPINTSILLNDPSTGYSYASPRTSTLSNAYNTDPLQPTLIHNRTYQISLPVGLAYKLSSNKNVEWFAGATIQPSYVFGGKAHLISADLKSYISDPSAIRHWNLNIGLETYMNYKLGAYNLQVGPQLRYQVYSTYRKDVALIEKPYAVGLKVGIVRGF